MAENILVTETLSDQMMKAGAKLVERLDASSSEVKSAFWLLFPEGRLWKLIMASTLVASEGPKNFYKRIVAANQLAEAEESVISLNDIGVTGVDHHVVQLLRLGIGTDSSSISSTRFSRNTINGFFIEDAYIYRSSK